MAKRHYGHGSIVRERSGRFRALLYDDNGSRISIGTFATRDAAEYALEIDRARIASKQLCAGGQTLSEYGKVWLLNRPHKDSSRWKTHVDADPLGSKPIAGIHPADVREWIDRRGRARVSKSNGYRRQPERRISRQTWQNALNLLRSCLKHAFENGVIKCNPASGLELPVRPQDLKAKTREPWTWLDIEEQDALLRALPEPDRWLVQFALWTGLRWSEQGALRVVDVHDEGKNPQVVVRFGSGSDGPTKSRRIRYVPMLPGAVDAWKRWRKHAQTRIKATGLAFPTDVSDAPRVAKPKAYMRTIRQLGISGQTGSPVTWHSLRHSAASSLVSGAWGAAWSLEEVKGFLGHKSITTTERYAHLANSALVRAAERLRNASKTKRQH